MLNAVALNAILDVDECLGRLDEELVLHGFHHQRVGKLRGTTEEVKMLIHMKSYFAGLIRMCFSYTPHDAPKCLGLNGQLKRF